ncbi:MAG: hypothetical protein ACTSQI_07745 [Candidatus Helarchaeota archaeon]
MTKENIENARKGIAPEWARKRYPWVREMENLIKKLQRIREPWRHAELEAAEKRYRINFAEFYEKLKYPVFPTVRPERGTTYYRLFYPVTIEVKGVPVFKAQIIGIQRCLLMDLSLKFMYWDILKMDSTMKYSKYSTTIKQEYFIKMRNWYKKEEFWKGLNTKILVLTCLNLNYVTQ